MSVFVSNPPAAVAFDERRAARKAGADAWAQRQESSACPYALTDSRRDAWLHGWWGAFYRRRDADEGLIAGWIDNNVSIISCASQSEAVARILVHSGAYSHWTPITGNVLAGHAFDVPAPCTLAPKGHPPQREPAS